MVVTTAGVWTFYFSCLFSPALFWGADRLRRRRSARRRAAPSRSAAPGLPRPSPSLETLVADLHRLERTFREIEAGDAPAKWQRLRAVSLAYDDVLAECCLALGLPVAQERPLSALQRLYAESELAMAGLTW